MQEPTVTGIYESLAGGDDENEENKQRRDDQEQYEEIAAAMLEDPDGERLQVALQIATKKMHYKEAWKVLAKSRVTRALYPIINYIQEEERTRSRLSRRLHTLWEVWT